MLHDLYNHLTIYPLSVITTLIEDRRNIIQLYFLPHNSSSVIDRDVSIKLRGSQTIKE